MANYNLKMARKFNGKKYYFKYFAFSKSDANKKARAIRRKGFNARVIQGKTVNNLGRNIIVWRVYAPIDAFKRA